MNDNFKLRDFRWESLENYQAFRNEHCEGAVEISEPIEKMPEERDFSTFYREHYCVSIMDETAEQPDHDKGIVVITSKEARRLFNF